MRMISGVRHACVASCIIYFALLVNSSALVSSLREQHPRVKPVEVSSDQSLWRIDLHTLGYPADNPKLQLRRGLQDFNTADFVGEDVVVGTFVTEEPIAELQRRDDPNRMRPYRLHAIFLHAGTGKILKTLEWPVDDPSAGIFPRYDGSFLLFTTEHIVLYSADWTPLKELPLPQLRAPQSSLAGISESPSGNVLVIRFHQDQKTTCIHVVTDTLDSSQYPCEIPAVFTVSDNEMAMAEGGRGSLETIHAAPIIQSTPGPSGTITQIASGTGLSENSDSMGKVVVRAPKTPGKMVCDTSTISGCEVPQFVNNDMIVVYGAFAFGLVDHKGISGATGVTFKTKLNGSVDWIDPLGRPVRPSENGQRFAVLFNAAQWNRGESSEIKTFVGNIPASFPSHVDVYDMTKEAWFYTLTNKNNQFKKIWGLALSPSGERMAIDSGGVIQMYAVPAESEIKTMGR